MLHYFVNFTPEFVFNDITMTLQGLPFMLENILAGFLEQNVLTTRKISGGDSFENVSLRFKIHRDRPALC